ncbi:MAG TPA: PilZ domain-containing protein [Sphingomicrobium sp.]|nr:PilZ domain-containing protein [Sphingomicrobium sp.]
MTARQLDQGPEGRQLPRTHLFVAATLYADTTSMPVNIRNMSPSGALIEADGLPDVGTRISLSRGRLRVTGDIAWRADRRAGVRFEASVYVPDWMARLGSAGQQRVDAMLAIVKSDAPGAPGATVATVAPTSPASIEAELRLLRLELSNLETALIADVIVVATHPEIQTLDIAVQRIDRILRSLRAG